MSLSTQIIVGGHAEQALAAMQKTANAVRETARIAGASAREQYESYQLSIQGIKEEQAASEAALRSKIASSTRIQAAWQREKLAQDQAIDAEQAASRAKEMAALKADILARSTQQASQAATAYAGTLRMLGVEAKGAAASQQMLGESMEFGTAKMAYASASVRALEGHIGTNTRAVERFISETLGLAPVLQAAFPIVGAAALVGMLAEMAKKAYDAYENIFNLKSAIEGLDQAEITVTQKVKQEQDKTEQAKEDVTRNTQGNEAALRQHQQYQSAQGLDLTGYFYDKNFKGLPDDVKANYENLYKNIAPADIPDRLKAINKEVHDLHGAINTINDSGGISVPTAVNGYGPDATRNPEAYYQARLTAARQLQEQIQAQAAARAAGLQADDSNIDKAHADAIKQAQDKAAAAARQAQAEQRQADANHLRALQEQFELSKSSMTQHPWETQTNYEQRLRLAQSDFFGQHLKDFGGNTGEYKSVLDLSQKPLQEYNQKDAEGRAALQKMLANPGSSENIFSGLGSDKDTQARLKAQQDAISSQAELSIKLRESAIAQELQNGMLSKYDAAVQMAALHTEAYQLQLDKLKTEAQQITNDPTLNEEQRRTKLIGIGSQVGQVGEQKDAQGVQDQQAIASQSFFGAWRGAMDEFVQKSRDSASQWISIWNSTLDSVNNEIVKVLSTRHNHNTRQEFGNIGASMFRGIAGAGLQKGEGAILGALGLGGKADGSSQGRALWVRMAGVGGAASSAAGSIGSAVSSAAGGVGGFLGKIGGFFSGLGFADGGMPPIGMASLVGERGPELFVPHTSGTIVPNSAFGGHHSHTYHIDARGNPDPAATIAIVHREMVKARPAFTANAVLAQHDRNARRPSSSR